jgi:hypothetical protein
MTASTNYRDGSSDHVAHAENHRADQSQTSGMRNGDHNRMQRSSHFGTQPVIQSTSLLGAQLASRVTYRARVQRRHNHHPEPDCNEQAHQEVQQDNQEVQQAQQRPAQTVLSFAEGLARLKETVGVTLPFQAKVVSANLSLLRPAPSPALNEWAQQSHAEDPYNAVDPSNLAVMDDADDFTADSAADASEAAVMNND